MNSSAIKDLLFRLADDELITGHRASEWTSLGPILEEDIAFSSMAQDELGHSQAYYLMLHEHFGEAAPDTVAFNRPAAQFRNAHLTEYPITDYAFSLVRHLLYDFAEAVRLDSLSKSSFAPLAELARKLAREEKYHQLHAITMVKQLGSATPESQRRMQQALDIAYPMALGLFEPTEFDAALVADGIMASEKDLQATWENEVKNFIASCGLNMPTVINPAAHYGGRSGKHTEHLAPMMKEMNEVFAIDPTAIW